MKSTTAIITALLFLFIVNGYAQKKQDVVVMRIYETSANADAYIRISYPDETTKTIALKKGTGRKMEDTDMKENDKLIQKTINSLIDEGYQLISSSGSVNTTYDITKTFIIFCRNKKE